MLITLQDVKNNPILDAFVVQGNEHLGVMGYTDHGKLHTSLVSRLSQKILHDLGYDDRTSELAAIAGYMHDIGNVINRNGHSQSGALMAINILSRMGMDPGEISIVSAAIGNHDEGSGQPVHPVAAALILADKSHVHRNRVRNTEVVSFDIHDRVNYAVESSELLVDSEKHQITMDLTIDHSICPVMEYFEIFLSRMLMCRRAAEFLNCKFSLLINGVSFL